MTKQGQALVTLDDRDVSCYTLDPARLFAGSPTASGKSLEDLQPFTQAAY